MKFDCFLKEAQKPEFWLSQKKLCFQASSYPSFFFYFLFNYLQEKKLLPSHFKRLNTVALNGKSLLPIIGQSVLGEHSLFWLGDIEKVITEKNKKKILEPILSYLGPNSIIFFINSDFEIKKQSAITINTAITFKEFQFLLQFFNQNLSNKKLNLVKKIFNQTRTLSLDFACMLFYYFELINIRYIDDFFSYLSPGLEEDSSLSQLADSFFSKNSSRFFKTWSLIEKKYSEMFWLSYWSEQIWRAYYVITFLKQKDFVKAKKMSFRLPFNFIKKDWKRYSLKQLSDLHLSLYEIDFAIKKGSTFCSFDLFYFNHLYHR